MRLVGVVGAVKMGRPGAVKMGRPGAAKMGRPGTGGGFATMIQYPHILQNGLNSLQSQQYNV